MQANLTNGPLTTHQGGTLTVSGTTLTDAKGKKPPTSSRRTSWPATASSTR
jgi:hypothetical protein